MRRRLAFVVATCLLLPAAAAAAVHIRGVDTSQYPRVRVTIVTSKPTSKPPTVLENGQPVADPSPVNFGSAKSVVLAVDRSQSMRGKPIAEAKAAATAFADAKPAADEIAVSTFATQALMLTSFSTGTTDAASALRSIGVDTHSGTTMYDDLVLSTQSLASQSTPGRVIIVVTDGNETSSHASLQDVIATANRAHVSIYVVAIESRAFTPAPLRELAARTGGKYYAAASAGFLRKIYASIADELSRTWQIGYLTAARPGQKLDVSASVPGQGSASASVVLSGTPVAPPQSSLPTPTFSGKPVAPPQSTPPKSAFSSTRTLVIGLVGALALLAVLLLFLKSRTEETGRKTQPHLGQDAKRKQINALTIWAGGSAFFMLIGAFGTWATALGVFNVAGTSFGDGVIVLVCALIVGAVLALGHLNRRRRWAVIVAILVAMIAAATAIYDMVNIQSEISSHNLYGLVSVGWGLWIDCLASLSGLLALVLLALCSEQPSTSGGSSVIVPPLAKQEKTIWPL
jgi:VWFA-related protein